MIIVMGAPGAGKTTVLKKATEGMGGWKTIVYGDLMFTIAKEMKLVADKDEIRKLDAGQQSKIQAKVGEALSKEGAKTVLDTHCSIRTPGGYLPGLPLKILRDFKVERLVLVEADSGQILARRRLDETRVRDAQTKEDLDEHLFMNRAYLAAYSAITGAPACIIRNEDGKLEEAAGRLRKLLGG